MLLTWFHHLSLWTSHYLIHLCFNNGKCTEGLVKGDAGSITTAIHNDFKVSWKNVMKSINDWRVPFECFGLSS